MNIDEISKTTTDVMNQISLTPAVINRISRKKELECGKQHCVTREWTSTKITTFTIS